MAAHILHFFLILLGLVPKERGGSADPFPPNVQIPIVVLRVGSSRSHNTIHSNISGLLASLNFHLLVMSLTVLASPGVILISFYPGVCDVRPSLYQSPPSRGSGVLMPFPTHTGAEELTSPPTDSKSSKPIQSLLPTLENLLPSSPVVPLVNVHMLPFQSTLFPLFVPE